MVGLGNPGPSYTFNRHNAGFLFLDHLCFKKGCDAWRDMGSHLRSSVEISEKRLFLIKPTTYMNLSGRAVAELVKREGARVEEIMVVYDDVSLPLGRLRIRRGGSDGGHNGMRSIINALETEDVARMRIGIGPKPNGIELAEYVLSDFSDEEMRILNEVFDVAIEALEVIIKHGMDKAMSLYNSTEVIG